MRRRPEQRRRPAVDQDGNVRSNASGYARRISCRELMVNHGIRRLNGHPWHD
jgi:hypothetical protein